MEMAYIYTACFLPPKQLSEIGEQYNLDHLDQIIKNPHMTLEFHPSTVDETLFGEEVKITLIGYGNNGQNEGFKVVAHSDNPKLQQMINQVPVPHITLSTSHSGKPVDTKLLKFSPIEPTTLFGKYGAYSRFGQVITTPNIKNLVSQD